MNVETRWNLSRIALTALYLWGGWLLFTWSLLPASLVVGALCALLIACFAYPLFIDRSEVQRRSLLPNPLAAAAFLAVLVARMYLASFAVLLAVLRGKINPRVVHFRTRLRSDIARVTLANAITITPGTVTLGLDDDHLVVHWLQARTTHSRRAGELVKGPLEALLRRVFG